jgi:hypothetical protein
MGNREWRYRPFIEQPPKRSEGSLWDVRETLLTRARGDSVPNLSLSEPLLAFGQPR